MYDGRLVRLLRRLELPADAWDEVSEPERKLKVCEVSTEDASRSVSSKPVSFRYLHIMLASFIIQGESCTCLAVRRP